MQFMHIIVIFTQLCTLCFVKSLPWLSLKSMAQKYLFYRNIFLSFYRNIVSRVNWALVGLNLRQTQNIKRS